MRINKYLCRIMLALGMALILVPGTVAAQEDEYVLEDTVVTATKMGETMLQETALSIKVFDSELIDDLAAFNVEDLANFDSSLKFVRNPFAGMVISIRGISDLAQGPNDQNISTYIDGVFLHQSRGAWADMIDVERVEVLKGPQGVLWGRNNTGGAVNIVSKKPSDELELEARVTLGNYALRRVDAMISGPIVKDRINARISVADSKHDGMIDNLSANDLGDQNYWAVRGALQILPTDNIEIMLRGDYRDPDEGYWAAEKLMISDATDPASFAYLALNTWGVTPDVLTPSDFYTVNENESSYNSGELWGVSGELLWDFANDTTLRVLTAYRETHDHSWDDNDDSVIPRVIFNGMPGDHVDSYILEVNLNGTWGDRIQWVVGGDYLDVSQHRLPAIFPGVIMGTYPPHSIPGRPPVPDNGFVAIMDIYTLAYAFFGNLQYDFTDQWSVSAGIRWSYEDKHGDQIMYPYIGDMILAPGGVPTLTQWESDEWTEWTPRLVFDYKATEDVFLYASVAKGFKSGGGAPNNLRYGRQPFTQPETVWVYEAGIKSDWLDKRLRVNGAVWKSDYEDYQVNQFLGDDPLAIISGNAGGAEIIGVEMDVTARPTQNLTLNASVTYLDTEYQDLWEVPRAISGNPMVDATGNQLEHAPEWAYTVGASYVVPIENHGFLTFGADASYTDDVPVGFFAEQDPEMWIPDYTLVNARVRYETEDGQWALEAYGRNIFEKEYIRNLATQASFPRDVWMQLGTPMTMGVRVTYKY